MIPFADPRERLTKRGQGRVGRICSAPGCAKIVPVGERYCAEHQVLAWQADMRSRGNERVRGYGRLHRQRRNDLLRDQPLCAMCLAEGRRRAATVRDHIVPLAEGGDESEQNAQSLCRWCHARKSAAERRARKTCNADGKRARG